MSKNMNVPKLRFSEFSGEWEEKKLSNIISLQSGFAFKSENFSEDGNRLVIPKNFTKNGYGSFDEVNTKYTIEKCDEKYICKTNDLLILLTDLTPSCELLGKPLLIKKEDGVLLLNQRIAKVLPTEYISVEFLQNFFLTTSYHLRIKNTATGSTVRHSSNKIILDTDVYIPSKQEQEKIASFLTSVDTKIEQLTKKEVLLQEYKKGVMSKIFNQEVRFKDDNGREFPEWEEKRLGDIGEIVTGKTPSTTDIDLWNGDIRFITPTDIDDNVKYQSITQRTVVKQNKMKVLPIGSIVYTCIASIGKMQLTLHPSITNQQINSIIVNINHNNEFIYYSLLNMTPYIKSTQSNTTLAIINKTEFSKFIVGIPSLKEQTKIANFLSSIDKKIYLTTKELNSTKEFKKALLQQMFA